ncbi:hypothetical protein EFA69_19120 [Rufibacter immobilis]|uniref:Uncharacterized protein n=1 Tax=Rufibacter immobilis TaxID=1348778 RepID=A0A3M9MRL8_9BACT|nr:hypothetical protein [Rufibacter immobilis]RNI28184.1 hypothetical protein EFA69_19120 [Rufibacter immobilis]
MKIEKLKMELGAPEYGWLPVKLTFGDFDLQFKASDVPANPIDQLITSLRNVIKGINTEVWWHLEPEGYYFEFERISDKYRFKISFEDSDNTQRKEFFELDGDFKSVILPIYRAIVKFIAQPHNPYNWPQTNKLEAEELVGLVKEIKTT